MSSPISIKGGRDGLRLQLDESAAWAELLGALRTQLERGAQFFHGAHVIVDIGERALGDGELTEVLALMRSHGLEADALVSSSRESRTAARSAGLSARPMVARPTEPDERNEAIVLQRTIRSGQIVRHHGHITIIGDVNPGAEVIAGGSIFIWGRVRGIVHAGALGDREAIVCALDLRPAQLRIAHLISRSPDEVAHAPEVARISGEQISVNTWDTQKQR